ncbi:MAG: hypothetical protein M1835_002368 [Candelina submexicana]|nr:MAG: hypothetical protein M1835_002368 [Candelina submexicana]
MTDYRLPAIETVPNLSTPERAAILDHLFEPSIPLHTLSVQLLHENPFPTYQDMIARIGMQLTELSESTSTSDTEWLEKILGAHPRLGEKRVDSAQSRKEQAQLNAGGTTEELELKKLNDEYEKTFPNLKYVVFVNGRSRQEIMAEMQSRIVRADVRAERLEAIKVMFTTLESAPHRAVLILRPGYV